jgi:hypothetical protein
MEQPSNLWSPSEVRKTISLGIGGLIALYGIYLIGHQLTTTNNVSLNLKIFSATISSADAGIIVFTLGVILIIISILSPKEKKASKFKFDFLKDIKTLGIVITFVLLLVVIVITAFNPNIYYLFLILLLVVLLERIYHSK